MHKNIISGFEKMKLIEFEVSVIHTTRNYLTNMIHYSNKIMQNVRRICNKYVKISTK
jgi:hypothetical protein